nr:hypothetical protein [Limosilactobacillus mucosae]
MLIIDGYFHIGRIKEIRYAFLHWELPNFLNFQSFFGVGQAINAMYPDITLWPFVLLTLFLSPTHQVAMIKLLMIVGLLVVTYISLYKHNIPTDISLYSSILFTVISIYTVSFGIINIFSPSDLIIYIFIVPISFTVYSILSTDQIDKSLIVKFALIIILILYSHFLTIIVLGFVMLGIMLIKIVTRNFNIAAILNILMAGVVSLVGCVPIIYRYILFTKFGLVMPYHQGNIELLHRHFPYMEKTEFLTLVFLSVGLFLLLGKKNNKSYYIQLLIIEIYIYILGSGIFPWKLFNAVPLVNDLQFPERFQIYLYVIPVLMLADLTKKHFKLGIIIMLFLTIVGSVIVIKSYFQTSCVSLNNNNYASVGKVAGKLHKNDIRINQDFYYYDYYPSAMPNSYRGTWYMSSKGRESLINPKIKGSNKAVEIDKKSINNGIQISAQHDIKSNSDIILPVLGYKGLSYQTAINGRNVSNHIDGMNLAINAHKLNPQDKITVKFHNPLIYSWMIAIALLYDLALIIYLRFITLKSSKKQGRVNVSASGQ